MKLFLARHTESTYNVKGLLNADPMLDVRLSDNGILQAQQLAIKLSKEKLEVIYISELPRTKQTADIVNASRQIPIFIDKRINENIMGLEGQPVTKYTDLLGNGPNRMYKKFNDGESLEEVRIRVESFIRDLKTSSYSEVLVITHGCIIECMYSIINYQEFNYGHGHIIPQGDFEIFEI